MVEQHSYLPHRVTLSVIIYVSVVIRCYRRDKSLRFSGGADRKHDSTALLPCLTLRWWKIDVPDGTLSSLQQALQWIWNGPEVFLELAFRKELLLSSPLPLCFFDFEIHLTWTQISEEPGFRECFGLLIFVHSHPGDPDGNDQSPRVQVAGCCKDAPTDP